MLEILIGRIVGAHGIKGQCKVEIITQKPEKRFASGSSLWCDKAGRWLEVAEAQPHQSLLLVKFKGIDDRTAAEALFQGELRMHLADLEPLPEGEYYYVQLIGLDVYSEGQLLGSLVDILETGANDVYVIKRTGKKDLLVPALRDLLVHVDLEEGRMELKLPAGLLECYE